MARETELRAWENRMELEIGRLFSLTERTADLFRTVEPREWTLNALRVELVAEYGSLAHCVMEAGQYKLTSRFDARQAEDECSDVVFILLRILRDSGCRLAQEAKEEFSLPSQEDSPECLFLAALEPLSKILALAGTPQVERPIIEAAVAVAGLAHRLGLRRLEPIHEQTMRDTEQWIRKHRTRAPLARCRSWTRSARRRISLRELRSALPRLRH
jgi:hypothetical protein